MAVQKKARLFDYRVYADGSLRAKRFGAWASIISPQHTKASLPDDLKYFYTQKVLGGVEIAEPVWDTTISRMELLAIIEPLNHLPDKARVEIFSDSTYAVKSIMVWIPVWRKSNWIGQSSGTRVLNYDLMRQLDDHIQRLKLTARWVPRNSTVENARCDELAQSLTVRMVTGKLRLGEMAV